MILRHAVYLLCAFFIVSAHATQNSFQGLLDEAGMQFDHPQGFEEIQVEPNELLAYEHAVRYQDGSLEIRYIIRPLHRLQIDYDDPHSSAPEPNEMFRMLFDTLSGRLSGGRYNPDRTLHPSEARKSFSADWAALSAFDVEKPFAPDYQQALFLAIHKDQQADAYVVFLYNDYQRVKALINKNLATLRFK